MKRFFKPMSLVIFLATASAAASLTDGLVTAALACDYYASPNGGGSGLSQSSPFRIADFWKVAGPGRTLCLMDGVYTDSIRPPENLNGTASARITIKALNDGGATINGGAVRVPILLKNNDYFLIEGMNAHNGSCAVVQLSGGADNNIVRRVVAWDAHPTGNCMVWQIYNASKNLLEDIAGFGSGRKIIEHYVGHSTTVRRAWAKWEHWGNSGQVGPKMTYSLAYNSYNFLCENCIGSWDDSTMTKPINQPHGIFYEDGIRDPLTDKCSNQRLLGSIAYTLRTDAVNFPYYVRNNQSCVEIRNLVVYASHLKPPVFLKNMTGQLSPLTYANGTEIGGSAPTLQSNWTVIDRATEPTMASFPNIWNGAGSSGARVCYRYVDGKLTNTPLWPWPMNQRILDARKTAGKTPVDVTKTMEEIFGPIPSECRDGVSNPSSGPGSRPAAPVNLDISPNG